MFISPYSYHCALSNGIPKIQFPIDSIHLTSFRTLSPSLIEPITMIIHASLINSIVQKSMKYSYITPIIKKTTRTCRDINQSPSLHQSLRSWNELYLINLYTTSLINKLSINHYQFNY